MARTAVTRGARCAVSAQRDHPERGRTGRVAGADEVDAWGNPRAVRTPAVPDDRMPAERQRAVDEPRHPPAGEVVDVHVRVASARELEREAGAGGCRGGARE